MAAYDLGASAKLVQAINDDSGDSVSRQRPIDLDKPKATGPITEKNWTEHLEQEKCVLAVLVEPARVDVLCCCSRYYSAYLDFFLEEISATSVSATLEKYVFSPGANGNGSEMFARFMGGT